MASHSPTIRVITVNLHLTRNTDNEWQFDSGSRDWDSGSRDTESLRLRPLARTRRLRPGGGGLPGAVTVQDSEARASSGRHGGRSSGASHGRSRCHGGPGGSGCRGRHGPSRRGGDTRRTRMVRCCQPRDSDRAGYILVYTRAWWPPLRPEISLGARSPGTEPSALVWCHWCGETGRSEQCGQSRCTISKYRRGRPAVSLKPSQDQRWAPVGQTLGHGLGRLAPAG